MGRWRSILAGAALLLAPAAHAQNWTLVWSDEFSGSSVNAANWSFEVGGGGWGNNELEYYTNGANASVSGGVLTITANNVGGGFSCWYGPCQYTSTRMVSAGKRVIQYGRVEARIALPMGQGLWPAFWMLGSNIGSVGWPLCGETDIMEHINLETLNHGTIHWDAGGHASYGGSTGVANPTAYHLYAIEWTPSSIKWFVDGAQYHEANILNGINSTEEFHRPFFMLLNLAVGGNWPGPPNGATAFPASLLVDYVRVYEDRIFSNGFQSGDLSGWSSAQIDGGDLTVGAPGGLAGTSLGLRAAVNDTAGVFVTDETPDNEDRYRARFYFDPNGFDPGEAQGHFRTRIFIAFEEAPNRRLAAIVLRRMGGAYSLMGRARLDDNSQADTGFFSITDAPHFVEIDWKRSSGPNANDGSFQMWIDGASVSTRSGLDNSSSSVDFVRLGALSVKTGATGTLYFDEFVSGRASPIGP